MAQGKQRIWLLTFPDWENTGNLVNLFFYTGNIVGTQENFENLEFLKILLLTLSPHGHQRTSHHSTPRTSQDVTAVNLK